VHRCPCSDVSVSCSCTGFADAAADLFAGLAAVFAGCEHASPHDAFTDRALLFLARSKADWLGHASLAQLIGMQ
jgi:hypothetical protein